MTLYRDFGKCIRCNMMTNLYKGRCYNCRERRDKK
jgi:hypothetical protein